MKAYHDASLGDVIYTLPLCKELGVKEYYLKQTRHKKEDTFQPLYRLLKSQGINLHRVQNIPRVDYDFTVFRKHKDFLHTHLIQNYFDMYKKEYEYESFINIGSYAKVQNEPFCVFNITDRYRSFYNWQAKIDEMAKVCKVLFVGYAAEWFKYSNFVYHQTADLYDVALLLNNPNCVGLFCNPSAALTIAQGLDVQVFLKEDDKIKNAHIKRDKEELL